MKNIFAALVITALFASLGCSDYFQQDPLKGKGDEIEKAEPPDRKPDIAEPVDSSALKIDGPSAISFREDEESVFQFSLRVLEEEYPLDQVQVVVKNLSEFPGATFDPATLEFKWKPEKGIVSDYVMSKTLQLVAIAHPAKEGKVILRNSRDLALTVEKKIDVPQIKSVTFDEDLLREGNNYYAQVKVFDPEGGSLKEETPRLLFTNEMNSAPLAPFILLTRVDADLKSKTWTFFLNINLVEAEMTKSVAEAAVSFTAVNRYGRLSLPTKVTKRVATSFGLLDTTWLDELVTQEGAKTVYSFTIFDNRSEAVLSYKDGVKNLPKGMTIDCRPSDRRYYMKCRLEGAPQDHIAQRFNISLEAEFSNSSYKDSQKVTKTVTLPMKVLAAPTPTPTPTPAPTPTPEPTPEPTPAPTPEEN